MRWSSLFIVCLAAVVGAAPGAAQSLFSTRGLGVPIAPIDARAQALGGIGVGLRGLNMSLVNPASIAGVAGRGGGVSMQPSSRTFEYAGESDVVGGTHFPLFHVVYPTSSGFTGSVGYGSYLDQTWSIVAEGTEMVGGVPIETRDLTESSGGISQARLALAYEFSPAFAVGVAAGAFTGGLERTLTRTFTTPDSSFLEPLRSGARHEFSGPLAQVGARWDPARNVRLAGSLSWGGQLTADGVEGSAVDRTFDLPWKAAVGASAVLAPRVLAVVGGEWAGWESIESAFDEDDAVADSWAVGGGLEWAGSQFGPRTLPMRVGFRYGRMPFKVEGGTPTEWSVGVGAGFRLASDPDRPAAVLDVGLERGARGDAALTGLAEDFWRATVSMALFGL